MCAKICVFLAVVLVQFLRVHPSEACQCTPIEGTREDAVATAFDKASEVFLGEIIENGFVDETDSRGHIRTVRRVTFGVLQSWKGGAELDLTVDMPENGAQCGPSVVDEDGQVREPAEGDQFLVYAARLSANLS